MIEINLIPSHLRKKRKKRILPVGFDIPKEIIVGSAGGLLILLVLVHVFLLFINVTKITRYKKMQREWEEILPAKKDADEIISEMRKLESDNNAMKEILNGKDILWSQKLNIISGSLSRGVWLKKIVLNEDMFFIEGSAISREGKEMISVHGLTSRLKKNKKFMKYLTDFELSSMQMRKIKKIEIVDFLMTTKLDME